MWATGPSFPHAPCLLTLSGRVSQDAAWSRYPKTL